MRRFLIAACALIVLVAVAGPAEARRSRSGDVGLGLILGGPTGLSAEFRLARHSSIDLAIGLDMLKDDRFYVHLDYLFKLSDLSRGGAAGVVPYIGLGGFVGAGGNAFGARVPFGLAIEFNGAPLQIFGEIALRLLIEPGTDLDLNGAVGFRFFF